jgi:hypothetical protein
LNASHLLLWGTLAYGCEHDLRWADFGRSLRETGASRFKSHWGGRMQPLYQQFYLNTVGETPKIGNERQQSARDRLLIEWWRRMPLSVIRVVGPQVRRQMPFG